MTKQELIIFKNEDNGVTYYQHRCEICPPTNPDANEFSKKMNDARAIFDCNTVENRCRSENQHQCTSCDKVVCYFHASFIKSDNYCHECLDKMIAYIRKENQNEN